MIRSLPLAVLTRPVYAGVRNRRHYQSSINGASKTKSSFIPRGNPLGYGKVIHLWHYPAEILFDLQTRHDFSAGETRSALCPSSA